MIYRIRILGPAVQELARLDKSVGRRIVRQINHLTNHLHDSRVVQLTDVLADYCKLRVGNYRVFFQLLNNERTIVIHQIGHRQDIYS